MKVSYSNPIKFSGDAKFSPNQKFIAFSRGLELKIYDTLSLQPVSKYSFCDYIENIQWSNDSNLIMVSLYKRGIVEVKQIKKPDWICRITEGIAGICYALFSPDSKNILTICNNNIKFTIWSLTTKTTLRISLPKFSRKGLSFTSKGNFMALALRTSAKDSIGIYFLGNWTQINKFDVITTDLQDLTWSYDNSSIIIWDTPLVCKFFVYSPVGDLLQEVEPYKYKLGIRGCVLSPNGRIISAGCYDQTVKLFNNVSYTLITELDHSKSLLSSKNVNYLLEEKVSINKTRFVNAHPPISLTNKMPTSTDPNPKMGVKKIEFSPDSNFIAIKNENMGNVVFIWELLNLNLYTVIVHLNEVADFKWSPKENIIFIVTDNNKLYYYNLDTIVITELPQNFRANEIIFNSNGKKLIIKDPDYLIVVDYQSELIFDEEDMKNKSSQLLKETKSNQEQEVSKEQENNEDESPNENMEELDTLKLANKKVNENEEGFQNINSPNFNYENSKNGNFYPREENDNEQQYMRGNKGNYAEEEGNYGEEAQYEGEEGGYGEEQGNYQGDEEANYEGEEQGNYQGEEEANYDGEEEQVNYEGEEEANYDGEEGVENSDNNMRMQQSGEDNNNN